MQLTTLVIGTQRYLFDADVEELKQNVLEALRSGGGFVTLAAPAGRRVDVLITSSISARIEFSEHEDPVEAGAVGPTPLAFDDYEDYGL